MENIELKESILAKLEALLFIYGEPMEVARMAKILGVKKQEIETALTLLEQELAKPERGLAFVKQGDKIQLATKAELSGLLEDLIKQEFSEDLTPATLETLSIVAYASPITRADLEYIRGVNSSFILRSLVMRGLVERSINPKRSNAYIYSASFDLLKRLGLSSAENLPEYQKYRDLVNLLHQEIMKESQAAEAVQNEEGIQNGEL